MASKVKVSKCQVAPNDEIMKIQQFVASTGGKNSQRGWSKTAD